MPMVVIRYCDKLSIIDAITACIMFLYKANRTGREIICLGSNGKVVVEFDKTKDCYKFNLYKDIEVTDH